MEALFAYFIKVNIAIVLLYGVYRAVFTGDTFFRLRRSVLLFVLVFVFIYPFIQVTEWAPRFLSFLRQTEEPMLVSSEMPGAALSSGVVGATVSSTFGQTDFISWMYCIGFFLFIIRFLMQLVSIGRMYINGKKERLFGVPVIIITGDAAPFSFLTGIFVNPSRHADDELREILLHESLHRRQWHSVDVLIAECACVICWYNPFIWLLRSEVHLNLEHLADKNVISAGCDARNYQYHLLQMSYRISEEQPANQFSVINFKRRVMMMNKLNTSGTGLLKYLFLLPLIALGMVVSENAVANSLNAKTTGSARLSEPVVAQADRPKTAASDTTKEKIYDNVEVPPVFPGGEEELYKYLKDNLQYPKKALEKKIQGRAYVSFAVMKDGTIADVSVIRSVDQDLDAEAIRLVKSMPKWNPGKQKGEKVNVYFRLPIAFVIKEKPKKETLISPIVEGQKLTPPVITKDSVKKQSVKAPPPPPLTGKRKYTPPVITKDSVKKQSVKTSATSTTSEVKFMPPPAK